MLIVQLTLLLVLGLDDNELLDESLDVDREVAGLAARPVHLLKALREASQQQLAELVWLERLVAAIHLGWGSGDVA